MKKKSKILLKILIGLVGLLLLAAAVGWLIIRSMMQQPEPPPIPSPHNEVEKDEYGELLPPQVMQFEERRPDFFTFVIVGLTEGLNANTIMVGAYDVASNQAYIVSIPRDTRVDFQRINRKIVASYPVGRLNGGGHEGGIDRLKYEVSTLVGFRPDFYIRIDYEAFIRMVDAVGGVELYVPFRMYYHDPCQDLHINLQAGLQTLTGADALRFARYRTGTAGVSPTISDYQRIEHQQQVIAAVVREVMRPASILRIPEFIGIFNDYVYSDLTTGELAWFANELRRIGGTDSIHFYTLPMAGTSGPPMWYELADEAGVLELVNRTINPLVRDITTGDVRIVR